MGNHGFYLIYFQTTTKLAIPNNNWPTYVDTGLGADLNLGPENETLDVDCDGGPHEKTFDIRIGGMKWTV